MLKVLKNRFEQGYRTMRYPAEPVSLPSAYRGLPTLHQDCEPSLLRQCAESCPQHAINEKEKNIDLGRCVFCGLCERLSEGKCVSFSQNFSLGCADRQDLITSGDMADLAAHSKKHFKKLFGRSLQLRQVSAGGCNSCEADINVLNTPAFDLSRFGIAYVASPRHADGIHVTGPISKNMYAALMATYEAVPAPKVVIAGGSCAISGGPFHGSDEIVGDLNSIIPVDLYIPGCPPHPLTTLHALLNYFK
jgi:Ni,Fe-hydrogenase III small subunit/Pyruvate/2-oxoacid:ferredoxin oxidoreductase delta subunit